METSLQNTIPRLYKGRRIPRAAMISRRNYRYGWILLCCTAISHVVLTSLYATMPLDIFDEEEDDQSPAFWAEREFLFPPQERRPRFELFRLNGNSDQNGEHGQEPATLEFVAYASNACTGREVKIHATGTEPVSFTPISYPESVQVRGKGIVEVHSGDNNEFPHYRGAIMALEGCVDLYDLLVDRPNVKFTLYTAENATVVSSARKQVPTSVQKEFSTTKDLSKPHTRFVFSAESSDYFGYQVYANAMGFLQSNQTDASWMRLLTAQQPDDLSERFPTFTAPKSLYSKAYVPLNKPDIIDKWFHSSDAPHPNDTIVVINPDNWLLKDVHEWTKVVSSKNAVGHLAYYGASRIIQRLWREICIGGSCRTKVDPVGVPYIIQASDLKEVAPLWRYYTIKLKEKLKDPEFNDKYGSLGIAWSSEMIAYNAACATLKIKTKVVNDLQVRDVEVGYLWSRFSTSKVPMIHMGRAWFPKREKQAAAPWRHENDGGFSSQGIQVWCKCNDTAAKIQPWPLPDGMDFVSYHTLRLLHESREFFGPVPVNRTFRLPENHHRPL